MVGLCACTRSGLVSRTARRTAFAAAGIRHGRRWTSGSGSGSAFQLRSQRSRRGGDEDVMAGRARASVGGEKHLLGAPGAELLDHVEDAHSSSVERDHPPGDLLRREVLGHPLGGRCCRAACAVPGSRASCSSASASARGDSRLDDKAGHAVDDELRDPADARADDRQTGCHRLEDRDWQVVGPRRLNEHVELRQPLADIGDEAVEARVDAGLVRLALERFAKRAGAEDLQPCRHVGQSHRFDQEVDSLPVLEVRRDACDEHVVLAGRSDRLQARRRGVSRAAAAARSRARAGSRPSPARARPRDRAASARPRVEGSRARARRADPARRPEDRGRPGVRSALRSPPACRAAYGARAPRGAGRRAGRTGLRAGRECARRRLPPTSARAGCRRAGRACARPELPRPRRRGRGSSRRSNRWRRARVPRRPRRRRAARAAPGGRAGRRARSSRRRRPSSALDCAALPFHPDRGGQAADQPEREVVLLREEDRAHDCDRQRDA